MNWTGLDWTGLDWCQETHARLGSADLVAVAMPPILYLDLHKLFGFEVRAHGGVVRAHRVVPELTQCCQSSQCVVLQLDVGVVWAHRVSSDCMRCAHPLHACINDYSDVLRCRYSRMLSEGQEWTRAQARMTSTHKFEYERMFIDKTCKIDPYTIPHNRFRGMWSYH